MSGIFNTLLHGEPEDVLAILDGEPLTVIDLKAALSNAFKRIYRLEDQMEKVEIIRKADICISEEDPPPLDPLCASCEAECHPGDLDADGVCYTCRDKDFRKPPSEADDRETCAERAAFVAGYCKCYGEHKDPDWDEYGDMITAEAAGEYKRWRADE